MTKKLAQRDLDKGPNRNLRDELSKSNKCTDSCKNVEKKKHFMLWVRILISNTIMTNNIEGAKKN